MYKYITFLDPIYSVIVAESDPDPDAACFPGFCPDVDAPEGVDGPELCIELALAVAVAPATAAASVFACF